VGFASIVAVARGAGEKPTLWDGNSSTIRADAIVDEKPTRPRSPSMRGLPFADGYRRRRPFFSAKYAGRRLPFLAMNAESQWLPGSNPHW
jgi:hypothetical protein